MFTIQVLFAGMLPLISETESAVLLTVPPHCETFGTLARVMPGGKASLNATPVRGTLFGLVMVKVSADVDASAIGLGENTLLMEGGNRDSSTINVSQVWSGFVASWSLVSAPGGIQFW